MTCGNTRGCQRQVYSLVPIERPQRCCYSNNRAPIRSYAIYSDILLKGVLSYLLVVQFLSKVQASRIDRYCIRSDVQYTSSVIIGARATVRITLATVTTLAIILTKTRPQQTATSTTSTTSTTSNTSNTCSQASIATSTSASAITILPSRLCDCSPSSCQSLLRSYSLLSLLVLRNKPTTTSLCSCLLGRLFFSISTSLLLIRRLLLKLS